MSSPSVKWRVAEIFAFDTCTFKCAYCHFAETGKTLDAAQLDPFRDPAFVEKLADFFIRRTTDTEKWLLPMSGGEPLLMPNFELFCDKLASVGNRIALYTALLVGRNQPSFRYLAERAAPWTEYLMCSFHPEADEFEDEYFEKVRVLKEAGHSVIVRFVGHPKRLDRLDHLSERCQRVGVAFYPTTLVSPIYPGGYTNEQRAKLIGHMTTRAQIIQMHNGVDTTHTRCSASKDMIAIDLRTGVITPCVSVGMPVLGNIHDDTLELSPTSIACPGAGMPCSCDTHFQQDIVHGFEDSDAFARVKAGFVPGQGYDILADMVRADAPFSEGQVGIGTEAGSDELSIPVAEVKRRFKEELLPTIGHMRASYHPTFRQRMRSDEKT